MSVFPLVFREKRRSPTQQLPGVRSLDPDCPSNGPLALQSAANNGSATQSGTVGSSSLGVEISPYYIHIPTGHGTDDVSGGHYMDIGLGDQDQPPSVIPIENNDDQDDTVVTENTVYNCDIARNAVSPDNTRNDTRVYLQLIDDGHVTRRSDRDNRIRDVEDNPREYLEPINTRIK